MHPNKWRFHNCEYLPSCKAWAYTSKIRSKLSAFNKPQKVNIYEWCSWVCDDSLTNGSTTAQRTLCVCVCVCVRCLLWPLPKSRSQEAMNTGLMHFCPFVLTWKSFLSSPGNRLWLCTAEGAIAVGLDPHIPEITSNCLGQGLQLSGLTAGGRKHEACFDRADKMRYSYKMLLSK